MFADNLKTLRRARGLSQEELAGRLHVTRQTISKWENALSVPDAELLLRLAEELEVPVSRLLGGPVEEEPAPTRWPPTWPSSTACWPSATGGAGESGGWWPGCSSAWRRSLS